VLDEAASNTTMLIKESLHIRLIVTETLLNRVEGVAILSYTHSKMSVTSSSTYRR
jgi:hypothetical protein